MNDLSMNFYPFSHFSTIHEEFSKMEDQKKELCGPFTLAYLLRGIGFKKMEKNEIYQDYAASIARVNITLEEAKRWREITSSIKKGLMSREEAEEKFEEVLYDFELPVTKDPKEAGCSTEGLKFACESITDWRIAVIPIPSRGDKIYFTRDRFIKLIELLKELRSANIEVIANYNTGKLLDVEDRSYNLVNIILRDSSFFPLSKWVAGHFVNLAGFWEFEGNKDTHAIIRDTHKRFGFQGYHLQPLENFRKALIRDDGREGGLLILVPDENQMKVEEGILDLGLPLRILDNGSPFRSAHEAGKRS